LRIGVVGGQAVIIIERFVDASLLEMDVRSLEAFRD
jgi:hypothetical protein